MSGHPSDSPALAALREATGTEQGDATSFTMLHPSVLFVGECNPYGTEPEFALYDEPDNASGNRLRRILGLTRVVYRAQGRVNLGAGTWSLKLARTRAEALLRWEPPPPGIDVACAGAPIVLLGRKVAQAFRVDRLGMASHTFREGRLAILLPHPSGRCTIWNDPAAIAHARALLAPYLPVGTADDGFPAGGSS